MRPDVAAVLRMRREAYERLLLGADALLAQDHVYWTEKVLLSLVREVSRSRLSGLAGVMPAVPEEEGQE